MATITYHIKEMQEAELFRDYVAKCLRITTENTAKFAGGGCIKVEYSDLIKPHKVDKRTAEEIVADVITNAGIEVK